MKRTVHDYDDYVDDDVDADIQDEDGYVYCNDDDDVDDNDIYDYADYVGASSSRS